LRVRQTALIVEVDLPRPRRHEMRSDKRFIAQRDHVTSIEGEGARRLADQIIPAVANIF
jgi:hypothetical protein